MIDIIGEDVDALTEDERRVQDGVEWYVDSELDGDSDALSEDDVEPMMRVVADYIGETEEFVAENLVSMQMKKMNAVFEGGDASDIE